MRYNFTGSVITNTPAKLALSNKYAQDLLEQSDMFKHKMIVLESCVPEADDKGLAQKATGNDAGLTSVPEVDSITKAIDYIATNFGKRVRSVPSAKAVAAEHGITFPNL